MARTSSVRRRAGGLEPAKCSRKIGTQNTMAGNYGRARGYQTVDGQNVGDVLIAENLAHPLACGKYSCSRRQPWCALVPGIEGAEK
jgi:hypothetical protein